ncbi:MAG: alpha/beta hydrolase, partial [Desulfobulbaceae bacterium]|nr:alpha/beta hydrolase [Desulfobulbaceae bacterium]
MIEMMGLSQTCRLTCLAALATLLLVGCAEQGRPLMPTPAIYTGAFARPVLDGVPAERRSPPLDLLYFINRAPIDESSETLAYGSERSKSIAFGSVHVDMGSGLDWNELVAASQTDRRKMPIGLKLAGTTEMGQYPAFPYNVRYTGSGFVRDPEVMTVHRRVEQDIKKEIERRLVELPKKEIVLYIHGFNETFQEAAFTTAELCHFLGREQLCALFTWPAGGGGSLLYSYGQDSESADFSVGHLKKVIRSLTKAPDVKKIHLLAHSRGSAVLLQALRELMLETYVFGEAPGDVLKIENLVLMAADVDIQVALQKLTLYGSDPEMS